MLLACCPAFSSGSDAEGRLNIMAAGESGELFSVREGIAADDRPVGSDGLQTFGGVRALARYVKIEAVPATGGTIGINEASLLDGNAATHVTDRVIPT